MARSKRPGGGGGPDGPDERDETPLDAITRLLMDSALPDMMGSWAGFSVTYGPGRSGSEAVDRETVEIRMVMDHPERDFRELNAAETVISRAGHDYDVVRRSGRKILAVDMADGGAGDNKTPTPSDPSGTEQAGLDFS